MLSNVFDSTEALSITPVFAEYRRPLCYRTRTIQAGISTHLKALRNQKCFLPCNLQAVSSSRISRYHSLAEMLLDVHNIIGASRDSDAQVVPLPTYHHTVFLYTSSSSSSMLIMVFKDMQNVSSSPRQFYT